MLRPHFKSIHVPIHIKVNKQTGSQTERTYIFCLIQSQSPDDTKPKARIPSQSSIICQNNQATKQPSQPASTKRYDMYTRESSCITDFPPACASSSARRLKCPSPYLYSSSISSVPFPYLQSIPHSLACSRILLVTYKKNPGHRDPHRETKRQREREVCVCMYAKRVICTLLWSWFTRSCWALIPGALHWWYNSTLDLAKFFVFVGARLFLVSTMLWNL
jgi:hypothetical protein